MKIAISETASTGDFDDPKEQSLGELLKMSFADGWGQFRHAGE